MVFRLERKLRLYRLFVFRSFFSFGEFTFA